MRLSSFEQYPDEGGGGEESSQYLNVPPEKTGRTTFGAIRAAGKLHKLFSRADMGRLHEALDSGDIDVFYAELGITRQEAEEIWKGLREPAEKTLQVELRVFEERLPEFLATHPGEHVLIHKEDVGGFFPTQKEGIDAGYQQYGNVPFLVQQVLEEQPVVEIPGPR